MTVIVIEDDRDIGLLLQMLADLAGHEDVELVGPDEAMAIADWSGYGLVITDWMLDDLLTGGDVIAHARAHGAPADARFVIYSALVGHFDPPPNVTVIGKGRKIDEIREVL